MYQISALETPSTLDIEALLMQSSLLQHVTMS